MNTLIGYDLVPEAKILDSALRACRRLNDLASAIRILEAVKVSSHTIVLFTSADIENWTVFFNIFDPEFKFFNITETFLNYCCKVHIWNILQDKAGNHKDIYPYLIQELKPTLSELGISTPEELGIDKL